MARYADIKNGYAGVNWKGADPDIIGFRDELAKKFPQLKVTSAVRTGSGVGKSGATSRHNRGQALDLEADPDIQKFLYTAEGDALLRKYKLGFLDETLEHNLKATGGTGPHLHIGKDSTLDGNQHRGNTAFERIKHTPNDGHDHSTATPITTPTTDGTDPNNVNNFYAQNQTGQNTQFLEQIWKEKTAREEELAAQVKEQEAAVARQNAIQERLKQKMDNQIMMTEMIKGHNLEGAKRERGTMTFADGGEFEGLNDNIDFKIQALKASMPQFTKATIEGSPEYQELIKIKKDKSSIEDALRQAALLQPNVTYIQGTSQPEITSEPTSLENPAVPSKVSGVDSASKLYNELSGLGLQKHQVAGILGALSGESGINLSSKALNKSSGAFGIAQWLGSRLTGLKEFGKKLGRDFKNEDIQIAYLLHELQNTSEKNALTQVKKAKTLEEAASIWTRVFERPHKSEVEKSMDIRIKNARAFEKQFS